MTTSRSLIAVATVIWLGVLALLIHHNAQNQELAERGVTVTGTVVNERKISGKGESYYLTVRYSLKDRFDTQEFSVTKDVFNVQPTGSQTNVTVDPNDIQHSSIGNYQKDDADSSLRYMFLAMTGSACFIGFVIYAESSMAKTELKRLANWNLGALTIEHFESVYRAGITISGHYLDSDGKKRPASVQNYTGSVHVDDQLPILYNDLGSTVVSLKSLSRTEIVSD